MKIYRKWLARILVLSAALNLMIEWISRKSLPAVFTYGATQPFALILNVLIVALPFTAVFLVKRRIFVCVAAFFTWLLLGVVNGILLIFRTTPFTASDLRLVKYALGMVTTYLTWPQILLLSASSGAGLLFCVYLWRRAPVDKTPIPLYKGAAVVAVCAAVVLGTANLGMSAGWVAVHFGNIGQAYRTYGFPYCFSNSLFNTGISKPEDYGSQTIGLIKDEELMPDNTYELQEGVKPNVIMIQLESFFDPQLWRSNPVEKDPIPFFRLLKENFPSGYLHVPSVGAGTANTEFEAITGMNLDFFGPGEYPYKTVLKKTSCESAAYNLKSLGYGAHAIHNNEATFYDRHYVFSQLGFDTFTPIEYMYGVERNPTGWCKDKILTGEILKALDSTEGADFVYAISVQGHGAYPDFEYYCSQIHEMDLFIRELVEELSSRKEPTALVLYGDHLPGFEWSEEEMENGSLYQTEYVIWNNMQLPDVNMDVESYQLAAHVFDLLGIHEGTMMRFHQNYLNGEQEPGDEEAYLEDMKALEYDILYGDHEVYAGASPYEATDLRMGLAPILVDQVVYNSSNVLVYGENFTPYSRICVDGKPFDTIYVWPELLIAKDVPRKRAEGGEVTVRQIGRDKVPLGEDVRLTETNKK